MQIGATSMLATIRCFWFKTSMDGAQKTRGY